jgi:PAS domain S-box-containing protein
MVVSFTQNTPATPPRILIVEDEGITAAHLASRLSTAGYEVAGIAESSEETFSKTALLNPDLILMDIHIKGAMDGIETATALRDRDIPVIYVSAHTDSKTIERAKVTGASSFLTKPINHTTLGISIEMALHKHQTDRELRNRRAWTEERFQLVVEAAPNAMIMVAPDGRIGLVNTQTEKLFGYTRGELLGLPVEILVPERFRPHHSGHRKAYFADPSARAMGAGRDLFGLRRDGSEVPVEIGLNPIITAEGQFVLASIIDITERKKNEERFQLVVEAAPNAMVMIGADGRIALVNTQTEKLFGYHRRELLGMPVERLVPQRFHLNHSGHRKAFFADPSTRAMGRGRDLFGLRRDGTEIPVEIGLNPIVTAEGQFVLASIIDITERKKNEERFQVVVEAAPSAMIMVAADGRIALVNTQTEKLFGYAREELLGLPVEMLVPERFRPNHGGHRNTFFAAPATRAMGAGRDLFGLRRDGSEVPIEIGLNPIVTADGQFVLASIIDITERKHANQEREVLIESLKSALTEKTVLLREVHHRVKNNLAVIAGLLGMQADAVDGERANTALAESQRRVMSMALIHEYLYATEHLDRVNFGKYVEQLAHELGVAYAIQADLVGIAIEAEEIELPVHRAIPCGLILNELLSNAMKYAFPDGRGGRINVRFSRLPSGELSLSCHDDGIGIAESFNWENPKSLGLRIIRILTKQIDGELTFDGSRGGTRFELRFRARADP